MYVFSCVRYVVKYNVHHALWYNSVDRKPQTALWSVPRHLAAASPTKGNAMQDVCRGL